MIDRVIHWSVHNPALVLLLSGMLLVWGVYSARDIPLDALPDLSDVQVIIKTSYPGQAPQVVEDQVTYPLTSALLSVPGAVSVRGYSFFGDSFIYVIFEDDTDLYWARSRVLEYLSQVADRLPAGVHPRLGPDASGVGWIFQYALVDRSGRHDLSELRSIQDWFLKYELQTVPGVAEVATLGGMVRQYQVVLNPTLMQKFSIPLSMVKQAITDANKEVGGSTIEMAEAEYMVHSHGYLTGEEDLRQIHYVDKSLHARNVPATLGDLADIRVGPQMRRGIAELDGEGEVVGGIVVMRSGGNALQTIERIRHKLDELRAGLPDGVEIVTVYDRSRLIRSAIDTLGNRLTEEFIAVVLVCALFLLHLRSALVVLVSLPAGILVAFIVMQAQGINANIMSLGGIAIAIGAMVDATIVMIENVHKHVEQTGNRANGRTGRVVAALQEVGTPLFFSLLIVTLSFLPVLSLQGQEGRLFDPLVYTKTYAMAAAAGLSVTLVPVLILYLVRGRILGEQSNPVNRFLIRVYRPAIQAALRHPVRVLAASLLLVTAGLWPLAHTGVEFVPELDEGDLLYMPSLYPGISTGKARQVLQQTDRLIRSVPEVERVFGKVGRAETATDPAPLTMIETLIRLRPKSEWRPGMTLQKLKQELNERVNLPGITNTWLMPVRARIDMLSTGIRTPVGIKIAGPDLAGIEALGRQVEQVIRKIPGTVSVYSERVGSARYIDIRIDRAAAARNWVTVSEVQDVISTAVGGMNVTETVEGRERYPVNIRYPREWRDSADKLRELPMVTRRQLHIQLGEVAEIGIKDGPGQIKSENARLNGWVYIDIEGRDLGSYVEEAKRAVAAAIRLPPGYSLDWSGQYEHLQRARERLSRIAPIALASIVVMLYLIFGTLTQALMVIVVLPLAIVGGVWLVYLLGHPLSVSVGVGFIAVAGVAAEFGVIMLVYLDQAIRRHRPDTPEALQAAIIEGAVQRVRPKAMTVAVILAGLLPVMLGGGTGSEVMRSIAAPMVGGMISAPLVSLFLVPVLYQAWMRRRIARRRR